jgi:hypothetical protein
VTSSHVELVNLDKHQITTLKPMFSKRAGPSMALLEDGKVLIVGGTLERNKDYSFAELYDPESQEFTPLPGPPSLSGAECFLLPNQKVLIFGAHSTKDNNVIIYDVPTRKFLKGPQVLYHRGSTGITSLKNGDVLVTGGYFGWKNADQFREAEIYKN